MEGVTMRILVMLLLLVVSVGASATWLADSRKNCKLEWPASASLQFACHDRNAASRRELRKLRRQYGDVVRACKRANPGAVGGIDYSSALVCVRYELKNQRRK
jgi:hypothetical protein